MPWCTLLFMTKEEFEEQLPMDKCWNMRILRKVLQAPSSQIMDWIEEGRDVVLEIEVQGHDKLKKNVLTVSAYLYCRFLEELENGFVTATEDEETIQNGWLLLKRWKPQEITIM
ncbi:MAG: hypothetical protein ACLSCV_03210 [Acutalibacteraceae bacterium]